MAISRTGSPPGKYTVCTSSTHPSSPAVGDKLFETDTGNELTYQGATDTWTQAWNQPWGFVAEVTVSSSVNGGFTTIVDITGLTLTVTALANRRWKITMNLGVLDATTAGNITGTIADGSNTAKGVGPALGSVTANDTIALVHAEAYVTTTAASLTFKGRIQISAGTGTVRGDIIPATLLIEDMGPNGAPS